MEAFPFTDAEWAAVRDATLPLVNAALADDPVLQASHLVGLLDVLAGLRARYGDHPVLLETEADFIDDDSERVALYRRAADIAAGHNLPTLSIRLSLAGVLLDAGKLGAAQVELRACESELAEGDESDRAAWAELVARSGPSAAGRRLLTMHRPSPPAAHEFTKLALGCREHRRFVQCLPEGQLFVRGQGDRPGADGPGRRVRLDRESAGGLRCRRNRGCSLHFGLRRH